MDCGPSSEGLFAYWDFNESDGQVIRDVSGSGYDGTLGDAREGDSAEPVRVEANYIVDSDGDGYADKCDNCPDIPNDQAADQDGDGAGNACDLCSNDGPDPDGGPGGGECVYASSVAVVGGGTAFFPTVIFNWGDGNGTAPFTYMVPQDCDNIVFECWVPGTNPREMFNARCDHPTAYTVTVSANKIPGGDLVLYSDGDSTETACSLLKRFPLEAFANGACCHAIYIASTEDRDYDWSSGECLNFYDLCIEPIPNAGEEFGTDFQYGQIFTGTVTSNEFCIGPTISVPVNIKHTSFPNSINLSGGGVITVGIYTSGDFNAQTLDPLTVRLVDPLSGAQSGPPVKSEIDDLNTLCGDPGDIGACNPDSEPDLLLHFAVADLPFTQDLQVTVSGQTFGGVNILGFDNLIVR
jgi:hypothetical protein